MNNSPFKTYEVTSVETKTVATITEENIGRIAALIKGTVDYSGGEPVLVEAKGASNGMRWKIGMEVSHMGGGKLVNQSGFTTSPRVIGVKEVAP